MAIGILVLGVLYVLMGLFNILWGIGVTGFGSLSWLSGLLLSQDMQEWGGSTFWGGLLGIGGGILQIITAFGLFARRHWGWLLAWLSVAVSLIGPLLSLFNGNLWAILGLIIPGIIFWYLSFDDDVKRTFRHRSRTATTNTQ